jgi:hypothetical protein
MMAEFIEEGINEIAAEDVQEIDQPIAEEVQEEVVQQQEAEEIPEKYKGKDLKEIIRMHSEAEKLIGRQGSEVGELRKIVDDFIKAQTTNSQQPAQEDQEIDFFADPQQAIAKAIENHPKVKQAEMAALQMKQAETISKLRERHPDFMDIAQNVSFQEWVSASKVRTELFARANNYDYDSADELISNWKERKQVAQTTANAEKQDRERQLKAATATAAKSSEEAPSKKIYRRADIIKLMQTDPDKYDLMQDEIMNAYREGRVR